MSNLSSRSRGLLDAARSARPTSAARERMGIALAARLGVVAIGASPQPLPGAPVPAPAPAPVPVPLPPVMAPPIVPAPLMSVAAAMSTAKGVVLVAVLSVAGVGAAAVWPDSPQLSRPTMHSAAGPSSSVAHTVKSAAPSTPLVEAASLAEIAEVPTPPLPETPPVAEVQAPARDRAPSPRPVALASASRAAKSADQPTDVRAPALKEALSPPLGTISLGEETASLGEAQRALKQGNGARAIALLDELAARHPTGVLREERLAARVFALCAAGHIEEARAARQRFLEELPASVQVERVRAACASSSRNPR